VSALEVVVGLGILLLAVQQWRRRPRDGAEPVVPGWLQAADRCTPTGAFVMGAVLVLANPKNLALTVAAAGAVAGASTAAGERAWALVLFTVMGTAGLAVPLTLRILLGDRAVGVLTRWRRWLMVHGTPAGCALLGLVGALLVARGATV
jgi:threonine/homoserine/homoserine lactone efflux protein